MQNLILARHFVLSHKFRKALLESRDMKPLSGAVDMDGTYVHPAPRKANKKSDRIDYRLKENQNPDKTLCNGCT